MKQDRLIDLTILTFESKIDNFHLPFSSGTHIVPNRCNFCPKNYTLSTTHFVNVKLNLAWIKGILSYSHHLVEIIGNRIKILQFLRSSTPQNPPNLSITDYSHLTFILRYRPLNRFSLHRFA